jgi:nicotinamidase-related amidase
MSAILDPNDPTSPLSIAPPETALLLIDYQNMVLMKIGDGPASSVLSIALQLREWALGKGMSVFHCVIDTSPGVKPPRHAKSAAKWKTYEHVLSQNPDLGKEAYVLTDRAESEAEMTFRRTPGLLSALKSHGLLDSLIARGIRSLILAGVSTSGCILSTARAAPDRGFITTVVS